MFLGLDSSTQSLKALLIDPDKGEIISSVSVNFTSDFPEFNCPNGVLVNEDPLVNHSDPLLWVAAMDLLFERLKATGIDLSKVRGISGCGQQHGSVYVNSRFEGILASLDGKSVLTDQVKDGLSRLTSPVWLDSSTGSECEYLSDKIGDRLQTDTGSPAIERFTGAQINKFYNENKAQYEDTAVVHLVSSFLASLLCGENCPIDFGDGAGMNLLNLKSNSWDQEIADVLAPELINKLLPAVPSTQVVGKLCDYFTKYGLAAGVPVVAWTGDNPSSLVGMGAQEPGAVVISLGTSDTFFAAMKNFTTDPNGCGHVFGNPAGGCMSLICFKNGSLAREKVKDQYEVDWDFFGGKALDDTEPGNGFNFMHPYFESEVTPLVNEAGVKYFGSTEFCSGKASACEYIRAVVESQFVSMMLHSQWIGETVNKIRVTGGASSSDGICQIIADVFQCPVERINTTDSAALGGAMRATQAAGYNLSKVVRKFTEASDVIHPRKEYADVYEALLEKYAASEAERLI